MRRQPKAVTRYMQERTFTCTVCGQKSQAPKYFGRTNIGHVKHMYCYRCKETTPHIQVE